jgi:hypothetical protein
VKFIKHLVLLISLLASYNAVAIQIEFDYRFDTRGFFTDEVTGAPIVERRQILDLAASYYSGFTDQLTSINSGISDSWSVSFTHPSLDGSPVTLVDEVIATNTIKIFVGGSNSAPGVLGFAGNGYNLTASGSEQFINSVINRGQTENDFGVWGGFMWFNANNNWYFDEDASGLTTGNPDFLTTVTHEIGHILGFGEADSWFSQIVDGFFTGENAIASYGSAVAVDQYESHWAEGTQSIVDGVMQETLMDPSTPAGERQLLTELDYAAFADIGWEVAAVPLPAAFWLFFSAMSGFLFFSKEKQTGLIHA